MTVYVVLHTHRFGTSVYLVRSPYPPTEDDVVATLQLDFEPDREEQIDISEVEVDNIPTVQLTEY